MHDAFVSYSHKDRQWVVDRLVPPLRAAGLQVLTDMDDSFLLGAPSVENMERAVRESRHTLLVLTPNWIESDWGQFEGLLTTTADPAARARKLLPLLVRRCELPARIRFLSYADFTEDDHYDSQIRRLIATLQVSGGQPPAVQPVAVAATDAVPGAAAREGFEALADLAGH